MKKTTKMKYKARRTKSFRKDYKLVKSQNKDMSLLEEVLATLLQGEKLDPKYKDHKLHGGEFKGCRECCKTNLKPQKPLGFWREFTGMGGNRRDGGLRGGNVIVFVKSSSFLGW